jgi:AAA domain
VTNGHPRWRGVTKREPCPACHAIKWCAWTADGCLHCKHSNIPPFGMVIMKAKDKGAIFRPERPEDAAGPRRRSEGAGPSAFDAFSAFGDPCQLQARLVKALTPELLRELAGQLGVPPDSLTKIGLGWNKGRWTNPERDEQRRIIGMSTRSRSGKKISMKGSHRGVVIPQCLDQLPGPVLLVEGPSDVVACITMGLAAIGRPSNLGGVQIIARLGLDRPVIVVGENDRKESGEWPGQLGAIGTATSLAEEWGEDAHWTMVPEPFKDVRAWLNARVKAGLRLNDTDACRAAGQELLRELETAKVIVQPQSGLILVSLDQVEPLPVEWLWDKRIPLGMLSILGGDPALGKSTIAQYIAAAVSVGGLLPDEARAPQGEVLWLTSEDDIARVVVPKLRAAGADMSKILVVNGVRNASGSEVPFSLDIDLPKLEKALTKHPKVRLIVIDPLLSYLGKADYVNHQETRRVLTPLKEMCERFGVTVLGIAHLNKSLGSNVIHRLTGSAAFGAAARSIWLVCPHPEKAGVQVLVCAKLSVGPVPTGLEYTIAGDPPVVRWGSTPVTITAREALAASMAEGGEESGCTAWLRDRLKDGGENAGVLEEEADSLGYGKGQLRTAQRRLGIKPQKLGMKGGWRWELPNRVSAQPAEGAEGAEGGAGSIFGAPSVNQHGDSRQESA